MPYAIDTSPDAYAVQLDLLRQLTPQQRLRKTFAMSRQLKQMAMDAIRRRHPNFDESQVRLKFIELTYGEDLANAVQQWQEERNVG